MEPAPIGVVTISDRASAGVYEDKGGPGIEAALAAILASPWRAVVQTGVAPVAAGLISASAFLLSKSADHAPPLILITLATAAFCYFTKRNPLWALGAAALLGLTGLVS